MNTFFIWVLVVMSGVGVFGLKSIDNKLGSILEIQSEIRDSNWIMACRDIDKDKLPETDLACGSFND